QGNFYTKPVSETPACAGLAGSAVARRLRLERRQELAGQLEEPEPSGDVLPRGRESLFLTLDESELGLLDGVRSAPALPGERASLPEALFGERGPAARQRQREVPLPGRGLGRPHFRGELTLAHAALGLH